MIKCFYTILAAILASFACLAGWRLGVGETPLAPRRSYCDHCRHQLSCWQLIPVLGWLLQGGRCHYCHCWISPFLPLVELITAASADLLYCGNCLFDAAILLSLSCLALLASSDYFHSFICPVFLLGLVPLLPWTQPQWDAAEICLAVVFLSVVISLVVCFHGLGSGDAEYLAIALLVLGCRPTALLVVVACGFTILLAVVTKRKRVPLLPGLAFATVLLLVLLKKNGVPVLTPVHQIATYLLLF